MIHALWSILVENLRELKPKTRLIIVVLLIFIYILWYSLVKSRDEVKDELRSGKDALIIDLRTAVTDDNTRILKLESEVDSLRDVAGKLSIKNIMDSVRENTKLMDQNQNFIEKQNAIKRSMK